MSTLTIAQVASQAGAPGASYGDVAGVRVVVQTSTGKLRQVTEVALRHSLVLGTGTADATFTVSQIVSAAGGNADVSLRQFGHLPVTVVNAKGNSRRVTGASFNGHAVVLHTAK